MKVLSIVTRVDRGLACWTRISNLAKAMEHGGHEVFVGCYFPGGLRSDDSVICNGTAHVRIAAPRLILPFVHLSHMLKGDYDLVFANMQYACMYGLLGRATNVPLVFDRHGDIGAETHYQNRGHAFSPTKALDAWIDRLIDVTDVGCSSAVVCVSRSMMDVLGARGVRHDRLIYATNGTDLSFFKPLGESARREMRERLNIGGGSFVVGYLGGTARWQGVDRIIQAADSLTGSDIKVLVVGGSGKEIVTRNVIYIPRVPHNDMPSYYSACDVLALPRPCNPATLVAAPTKFAEYAAVGKPILTTPVGDPARIVAHHECGLVTSDCSPNSIAEGMVQLSSVDASELRRMGANARRLAELEYDWEVIGHNLVRGLERLL